MEIRKRARLPVHEAVETFEEIPPYVAFLAYIGFYTLLFLGYISQLLFPPKVATEQNRKDYPPLYSSFDKFYLNYVYRRIRDSWEKPICSVPGAKITLKEKMTSDHGWTYSYTEPRPDYLNLGSYNYLGFAQNSGPCADASVEAMRNYGCATSSSVSDLGRTKLQCELEDLTARFLQVEAAIVFGMGFATNSLNMSTIISRESLVLSDEKNHASLILGLKLSGATVRVYKHNDMEYLESLIIEALTNDRIKGIHWRKIFIVTEGIFSMEGSIVKISKIVALKKKYKVYIYLDEAHSIGALGPNGRGVIDYFNCDPKDIDVLMGTFTKSFGSAGGYIAGSKKLINHVRANSDAVFYANSMPPPVTQQIITSMKIIMGEDGTNRGIQKIHQLRENVHYFRKRLQRLGCIVYGNEDSPVVPMLVYMYSKATSRKVGETTKADYYDLLFDWCIKGMFVYFCTHGKEYRTHHRSEVIIGTRRKTITSPGLGTMIHIPLFSDEKATVRAYSDRKIATVGVGFPATPFLECRIRFCLSAAHSKEDLDYVLDITENIADTLGLRYSRKSRPQR